MHTNRIRSQQIFVSLYKAGTIASGLVLCHAATSDWRKGSMGETYKSCHVIRPFDMKYSLEKGGLKDKMITHV